MLTSTCWTPEPLPSVAVPVMASVQAAGTYDAPSTGKVIGETGAVASWVELTTLDQPLSPPVLSAMTW